MWTGRRLELSWQTAHQLQELRLPSTMSKRKRTILGLGMMKQQQRLSAPRNKRPPMHRLQVKSRKFLNLLPFPDNLQQQRLVLMNRRMRQALHDVKLRVPIQFTGCRWLHVTHDLSCVTQSEKPATTSCGPPDDYQGSVAHAHQRLRLCRPQDWNHPLLHKQHLDQCHGSIVMPHVDGVFSLNHDV